MRNIIVIALFILAGCAGQRVSPEYAINPQQAISMAAEAAPKPVLATLTLQVRTVGTQNGITYLNSEADYRDQRNVSVSITPEVLPKIESLFGGDLAEVAKGKRILVKGPVRRVTIWFFDNNGERTSKYYYQTHILVTDPMQVQII